MKVFVHPFFKAAYDGIITVLLFFLLMDFASSDFCTKYEGLEFIALFVALCLSILSAVFLLKGRNRKETLFSLGLSLLSHLYFGVPSLVLTWFFQFPGIFPANLESRPGHGTVLVFEALLFLTVSCIFRLILWIVRIIKRKV